MDGSTGPHGGTPEKNFDLLRRALVRVSYQLTQDEILELVECLQDEIRARRRRNATIRPYHARHS